MVELPKHVHRTERRGRAYLTYQRARGTPAAGPRIKLPPDPTSAEFWTAYAAADAGKSQAPETTVAALVLAYQQSPKFAALSEATKKDYGSYLAEFERRLGAFDAALVTQKVVQEVHDSIAARGKIVAAKHMVTVIKALYGWGSRRGFGSTNPAADIEFIPHSTLGAEPWPQWALDCIAKKARWEVSTFVALALYTGQRTSDVLSFRLMDVRGDTIPLRQSKTGKELIVPIHRNLRPVIAECRQRGFIYLVPGPQGSQLNTDRWRAMWQRETAKRKFAAIRKFGFTPHGLRKSAACRLAEAGCSDEDIASITGQSLPMVRHYRALYDQEKRARATMEKWENASV